MWHLDGNIASFATDPLGGRIDLLYPARGLHAVRVQGVPLPECQFLGVNTPGIGSGGTEVLVDQYTRTSDLVATYAQTPSRTVRPQIYWRTLAATSEGMIAGIELIASVQTSLLDSDPVLETVTIVFGGELLRLEATPGDRFTPVAFSEVTVATMSPPDSQGAYLFRPPDLAFSYAELVHPTDFAASQIRRDAGSGRVQLTHRLFREHLEKGVIRRGRLRGVFLSRENDERNTVEYFREFAASTPPLTT